MGTLYYTRQDVIRALRASGLNAGDTAFFTTSLGMIGQAEGVTSADGLNALFLDAIQEVMGPCGTILVPTYSYTFGGSTREAPRVFDPLTTPAEIGPFPNHFLTQPGVLRSCDPMMSVAGYGPAAGGLLADLPPTSYGDGCLFARLLEEASVKCVSIGLGPNWIPFFHHADWIVQVPYRYDKLFYGGIKTDTGVTYLDWTYYARAPIDATVPDAHELGRRAVAAGIWAYAPLARARIYTCDYHELFDLSVAEIRKDPWMTVKGPPCEITERP